jgi:hypothetical protein
MFSSRTMTSVSSRAPRTDERLFLNPSQDQRNGARGLGSLPLVTTAAHTPKTNPAIRRASAIIANGVRVDTVPQDGRRWACLPIKPSQERFRFHCPSDLRTKSTRRAQGSLTGACDACREPRSAPMGRVSGERPRRRLRLPASAPRLGWRLTWSQASNEVWLAQRIPSLPGGRTIRRPRASSRTAKTSAPM